MSATSWERGLHNYTLMWKCLLFVGTCIVYMCITSDRKYSLRNDNSIFKITQESPTLIHGKGWNIEYLSTVTGKFANNVIQAQLHWFTFEIWLNQSWFVVLISHLESNMEQHEITWNWQLSINLYYIVYTFIKWETKILHRQNSFNVQPKILDAKTKPIVNTPNACTWMCTLVV
jgi:hypothetical protein